jgi:aminoglycoside phosphotransferase (APT) family kinase protein
VSGQKMHADEIDTDVGLVGRLLAGQFPQWADLPIAPVPSAGTDNALYRLGIDLVVRLPRIHWAVEQVDKEHRWLPRLAPLLPVVVPVPLAKGEPAEGFPWHWSIYPWLKGVNPAVGRLTDPVSLAADLAAFVTALHRIDPAGGPRSGGGVPLAARDDSTRTAIGALHGMVDIAAVTAAWDAALRAPVWPGPSVWVHDDLAPGNLLMVGGKLSGVIDFGGLGVGDPACDLTVAWNLLPADTRNLFRAATLVDDATWERGRGFALSKALIQLPYYHQTNPVLAASARYVIGEVLADHRRAT